ncbi:MAG: RNA polymerase sigma factor [candidate division KSB1 bacterium]|nr:RNA polymerase sigma factor [candidate division KSB1 bacterium]
MQPEDSDLVKQIRAGDWQAFNALYDRYRDFVFRQIGYLAPALASIEDLYQEVWLRVVRVLREDGPEIRHVRAWLYRIAVNVCRDALRRKRRRFWQRLQFAAAPDNPVSKPSAPKSFADGIELRQDLEKAIRSLSPRQREVFVLKEIEGLTHAEIAEALGISVGTSKATLFQAVQALRQRLAPADASDATSTQDES